MGSILITIAPNVRCFLVFMHNRQSNLLRNKYKIPVAFCIDVVFEFKFKIGGAVIRSKTERNEFFKLVILSSGSFVFYDRRL